MVCTCPSANATQVSNPQQKALITSQWSKLWSQLFPDLYQCMVDEPALDRNMDETGFEIKMPEGQEPLALLDEETETEIH